MYQWFSASYWPNELNEFENFRVAVRPLNRDVFKNVQIRNFV